MSELEKIAGCTDGNCIVRKPTGMHTNGGCQCLRDNMKMQKIVWALKQDLATMTKRAEELEGELGIRRNMTSVTRLHNLCRAMEEYQKDSPFSAEAWDTLTKENAELRKRAEETQKLLEGEHDAHMECHRRAEEAELAAAKLTKELEECQRSQ